MHDVARAALYWLRTRVALGREQLGEAFRTVRFAILPMEPAVFALFGPFAEDLATGSSASEAGGVDLFPIIDNQLLPAVERHVANSATLCVCFSPACSAQWPLAGVEVDAWRLALRGWRQSAATHCAAEALFMVFDGFKGYHTTDRDGQATAGAHIRHARRFDKEGRAARQRPEACFVWRMRYCTVLYR